MIYFLMHSYDWLTSDKSLQRRTICAVWSCYVSWKYLLNFYLFWIREMKFVMECVARGVNEMAMEMSGAKYEPAGWVNYSEHFDELNWLQAL